MFFTLCGNTAMKSQGFFSAALSGIAEGWLESYVLYLAWPEWKGFKFYSPPVISTHLDGNTGIAGRSQGEYHKITGNVWVGLPGGGGEGGGGSAHCDGWETEKTLKL